MYLTTTSLKHNNTKTLVSISIETAVLSLSRTRYFIECSNGLVLTWTENQTSINTSQRSRSKPENPLMKNALKKNCFTCFTTRSINKNPRRKNWNLYCCSPIKPNLNTRIYWVSRLNTCNGPLSTFQFDLFFAFL